ncbi:MurR/RpiR family transcriptional regulator [Aerococcus mictus]|uniref:MurR/RpiR family transcriptional regulator n=1 Tax=Aerococcus mictus TaxID=2976810 RepID=UPI000DCB7C7B|nr:MurR/RpiR family transcriptional regulator [Aerococcus mictus]KAA9233746.1 MurR/RpiR family transcriptional regulator [Aerococcus mictus]MDL5183857.1 MurR/RpiR family transcriptional regulator [Aerococcus mictus]
MSNYFLLGIEDKLAKLSESEAQVGKYIIEHAAEVIQMNVNELAHKSGTSTSTVVRFCQSIGLKGFSQLKIKLSSESQSAIDDELTDIKPGENLENIKNMLLQESYYNFKETSQLINESTLNQIIYLVNNAPVIFTYGLGASHLVGEDLLQKFSRVGQTVLNYADSHQLATVMGTAPKDSLFFAISYSGNTHEVVELATLAKELNIKIIAMTSNSDNSLYKRADYHLLVSQCREAPLRAGATISLLNQLYLNDVLFLYFLSVTYKDTVTSLEDSRHGVEKLVDIRRRK